MNGVVFESKNQKIMRAGGEGFPNLAAWKSVGYKPGENIRITKISGLTDHSVQTMKIEWIEDYAPSINKGNINVIVAIKGPGKVKYSATSAASNLAAFKAMKETNDSKELSVSAKAEASYSAGLGKGSVSVDTSVKTSQSTKKLNENSGATEEKSGSEETQEYEIVKGSIAVRTATMKVMYDTVTKNHFLVMKGDLSEWSDIDLNDPGSVKTLVGYVLSNESAKTFLRGKLIVGESQYQFRVLQLPQ